VTVIAFAGGVALGAALTALAWVWCRRRGRTPDAAAEHRAYRELADHASDLLARLDDDGRLREVSPSWQRLGLDAEGLEGRSLLAVVDPDDVPSLAEAIARRSAHGTLGGLRFRLRTDAGETIWVEGELHRSPGGTARGSLVLAARDVSSRVTAAEALGASQARYRELVQALPHVVFETDPQGRITFLSSTWPAVSGHDVDPALGAPLEAFVHPDDREVQRERFATLLRGEREQLTAMLRLVRADGEERLVEVTARAHSPTGPTPQAIVGTLDDRTDAVRARAERDRLADILEATSDLVATLEPDGRIRWMNSAGKAALRLTGDVVGRRLEAFLPPETAEALVEEVLEAVGDGGVWSGETIVRGRDGSEAPVSLVVIAHPGDGDTVQRFSVIARDISRRKELEEQLGHLALRDPLTGLANRTLLLDRLGQSLARAARSGAPTAVLFFDLDRFKLVNDSLGHAAGDTLLRELAARVTAAIRPADTAARFGGDEFVVVCEDLDEPGAVELADRIAAAMSVPFALAEAPHAELHVSTSVGIAIAHAGDDPAKVLGDADSAMYRAKATRPGSHLVFDETVRAAQQARLDVESGLVAAVADGQLRVHYQPVIDLVTGAVPAVEALVRWQHPEHGLLGPASFVEIAEESGAIVEVGAWVLERAVATVASWRASLPGAADLAVGVNLSVEQITAGGLVERVDEALERSGLPAGALILEVTETMMVRDPDATVATLTALHERGVRLALDDFGTGYAPLTHLRRLPVDIVKVDRSFVAGMLRGRIDDAIVAALVELTGGLGLGLVAEGVEEWGHADRLVELGYRHAQGFCFSPPVDGPAAAALVAAGSEARWSVPRLPISGDADDRQRRDRVARRTG